MLKKLFVTLIILSSILVSATFLKIDNKTNKITIDKPITISKVLKKSEEKPIGKIIIPKVQLEKPLYDINSEKNNIEENVTILKESIYPDQENSILFIAAHSGEGEIAFFNDLDQLEKDDEIIIEYNDQNYKYQINKIYEQEKNGYITGTREDKNQLILTTCCPKKDNCQLIINSIIIES